MGTPEAGSLTIGEFGRRTGLTEKALRLYDERGLLRPAAVDAGSGYRYYHSTQVGEGRLVALLRAIDMPLADVETVMALPPEGRVAAVARYWYRVERGLDERRSAVRAMRGMIEREESDMTTVERVIEAGRNEGAFAAIARLAAIDDIDTAAEAYAEAMRQAYWESKDLTLTTAIAYAGCSRLLAAAGAADEETAHRLRSTAKGMMFNLASFSWPGWNEEGIEIGATDAAAGLAAARTNLAMAVELDKGDLALSRGHWMVGAHRLTGSDHEGAAASFAAAAEHARRAGADVEAELAEAFSALNDLAAGTGSATVLEQRLDTLRSHDDGAAFAAQVETARSVLGV